MPYMLNPNRRSLLTLTFYLSSVSISIFPFEGRRRISKEAHDRCVAQSVNQLGNTTATTCGTTTTDTTGCTVNSASDVSYGAGFAAGGGGVYICEFASDGIRIWFFAVSPFLLLLPHCLFHIFDFSISIWE